MQDLVSPVFNNVNDRILDLHSAKKIAIGKFHTASEICSNPKNLGAIMLRKVLYDEEEEPAVCFYGGQKGSALSGGQIFFNTTEDKII